MSSSTSSFRSESLGSISSNELAPSRIKQGGSSVYSEKETQLSSEFLQQKHLLLRLQWSHASHLQAIFCDQQARTSPRLWRCSVFNACCQDILMAIRRYRFRIFSSRSQESQVFAQVLEKQVRLMQMSSVGIFSLMEKISVFMEIKNNQPGKKSRLRDELLPIWNAGLYTIACDHDLLAFFVKQESRIFSVRWHPLSMDTVGHFFWRVALENSDEKAVSLLDGRNIPMPKDIVRLSLLLSQSMFAPRYSYESLRPSLVSIC